MPLVSPSNGPSVHMFKLQYKEVLDDQTSNWFVLDDDVSYALRMFEVSNLKPGSLCLLLSWFLLKNSLHRSGLIICRLHTFVCYIHLLATYICRLHTFVGYIHLQVTYICRLHTFVGYIHL